jgi:hypothetical protein
MGIVQEFEEKTGLKVENLNALEKETFNKMLETVEKTQLTPEKLSDYVTAMREAVEMEIIKEPTFIWVFLFKFENPKLIKLQARLQNYLLLEGFLLSPKRAREQLDNMITGIKNNT